MVMMMMMVAGIVAGNRRGVVRFAWNYSYYTSEVKYSIYVPCVSRHDSEILHSTPPNPFHLHYQVSTVWPHGFWTVVLLLFFFSLGLLSC